MLEKVETMQASGRDSIQHPIPEGCCTVRFLPKESGLRPIMNMRPRAQKGTPPARKRAASLNSILRNLHAVLNYHRSADGSAVMGASVVGLDGIRQRLQDFRQRASSLPPVVHESQPYFLVRLDIRRCFDSIPHELLYKIVEGVITFVCMLLPFHPLSEAICRPTRLST